MRLLMQLSLHRLELILLSLLLLFLPTQLGKHFWPDFAVVNGIRIDYLAPTMYVTDILVFLLFIMWVYTMLTSTSTMTREVKSAAVLYACFLVFLLINVALSGNITAGLYSFCKFLEYSFVFVYIAHAVPRVLTLATLAGCFAIGIVCESLVAFLQYFQQGSVGGLLYLLGERTFTASTPGIANASLNGELVMRSYGTLPHPNVLAGYLLVSMLLVFFYLFPTAKRQVRFFAAFSLLLGSVALLLTLSRVAITLWMVFVGLFLVWQIVKGRKVRQRIQILLGWLFIGVLSVILFAHLVTPRFLETSIVEESIVQRQLLVGFAVQMVLERPVMGVGLGNFLPSLSTYQSPLSPEFFLQPVHNIFLLVAAELGLIGISIFLLFIGKSFNRFFNPNRIRIHFPIMLCLLVILVTGLVDHYWLTLQQGQLLFALILGLSWQ